MALRIGELLDEAYEAHGSERWRQWVDSDLPFGVETARRLRAVYLGCKELPPEIVAELPRPWQALYALVKLPPERLSAAIAVGEIGKDMSTRAAIEAARAIRGNRAKFTPLDVIAGRLLAGRPDDLSPDVAALLRQWLG